MKRAEDLYPNSSVADMPNDEDRFTHNFIMKEKREAYKQAIDDFTEFVIKQKENVGIGLCEYDMGFENGKYEMLNAILDELKQI